ncbi:MAG: putative Ig domain-containing protein [Flavobacteriales bacterium]|nr:putative Ig domain-containing protein [Flavobacteriales bacterium]
MSDNLHPNNAGFQKMAATWYASIGEVLPACLPTTPLILAGPPKSVAKGKLMKAAVNYVGFPEPAFTLQNAPAGMVIGAESGLITWTPGTLGSYTFNVKAVNSEGSDTVSFTVKVQ